MKSSARLFLMVTLATLSGCVSVLPDAQPAAIRYAISPVEFPGVVDEPVTWSLAVDDPFATRAYDTAKIALTRSPGQIEYYAQGEWADRAPNLIRTALIRSFENSGRIQAVSDTVTLPGATFVLRTDVRTLHVDYVSGQPMAIVEIFAKVSDRRGDFLGSQRFTREVAIDRDSVSAIGLAFDGAISAAITDIVGWSFSVGNAAQAK